MDDDLLQFGLKAFVTLIVVVDPLGVAPSFVALTEIRKQPSADASQLVARVINLEDPACRVVPSGIEN
jgi:small neutral amino acid transporter SnatA (MarC family)